MCDCCTDTIKSSEILMNEWRLLDLCQFSSPHRCCCCCCSCTEISFYATTTLLCVNNFRSCDKNSHTTTQTACRRKLLQRPTVRLWALADSSFPVFINIFTIFLNAYFPAIAGFASGILCAISAFYSENAVHDNFSKRDFPHFIIKLLQITFPRSSLL